MSDKDHIATHMKALHLATLVSHLSGKADTAVTVQMSIKSNDPVHGQIQPHDGGGDEHLE